VTDAIAAAVRDSRARCVRRAAGSVGIARGYEDGAIERLADAAACDDRRERRYAVEVVP
jgi:hypothetical protein